MLSYIRHPESWVGFQVAYLGEVPVVLPGTVFSVREGDRLLVEESRSGTAILDVSTSARGQVPASTIGTETFVPDLRSPQA